MAMDLENLKKTAYHSIVKIEQLSNYVLSKNEIVYNEKTNNSKKIKNPKICIIYLVSPRDSTHTDATVKQHGISKMEVFIESLKTVNNYLPKYPILVFHEDYNSNDKKRIQKVSNSKVKFVKVDFNKYKNIKDLNKWMQTAKGVVKGRHAGYQMMCRFFSGVMQNLPELAKFDYYIRMDHDSFFIKPKKLNLEECIKKYNFDYMYRSVFRDTVELKTLWEFTQNYAKKNNLSLEGFKQLKLLDKNGNFNGISPYTNFHVSKLSFWKREDVKKFLKAVEDVDGIIKLRWDDATIQSILIALFNPIILEKTDFGYRHNFHYSLQYSNKIKYIPRGKPNEWP